MKFFNGLIALIVILVVAGCNTPARRIRNIELGMTPQEVLDKMGDPYTIRAAKVFDDGHSTEIWEYTPSFALNPRTFWVYFENAKVVQWGQPGDFAGKAGVNVPVAEYSAFKSNK